MNLKEIFDEFTGVVKENNKYVIGLLDNDGKIIFCSEQNKVGIRVDMTKATVNDFYHKVLVKKKDFGYLWVNSSDDSLKMVGNLLGESLNTRILYEMNEDKLKANVTKDYELINCLLDDTKIDMKYVLRLTKELNLNPDTTRVAVYVYNKSGFNTNEIQLLKVQLRSKELIFSLIDNLNLLFFLDIPEYITNLKIKEYIKKFIDKLKCVGVTDCYFIIGSLQNRLTMYSTSYKNCLWIKKNISVKLNEPVFFAEYLFEYFTSFIPSREIRNMFDYASERNKSFDIDELIQIADQLYKNDFNISQTADDLFLHKNSLLYKIKKYEELFDINIRGSFQGKLYLYLISKSCKEEKQQKQVGVK